MQDAISNNKRLAVCQKTFRLLVNSIILSILSSYVNSEQHLMIFATIQQVDRKARLWPILKKMLTDSNICCAFFQNDRSNLAQININADAHQYQDIPVTNNDI